MNSKATSYNNQLEWLFNQFPIFQKVGVSAYKPTLENTSALIEYFGIDLDELKFVHVAGTNGKGTTASIIASTFKESGLKTGLFTSPHIQDFRERIRINGKMIGKEEVSKFITLVQDRSFSIKPSFFEISWVMSLLHFQKEKCDVVVVETGLGGRLDATNVITPIMSVITNIGLDHTAILGNTLEEIAKEKAGIVKPGVPVIIGQTQEEIASVFKQVAEAKSTQIHFIDQPENATTFKVNERIARETLLRLELDSFEFVAEHFFMGIKNITKNTGFIGRFQIINRSPLIILDAAHNTDGVIRLIGDVNKLYPGKKIHAVYGASNDKELSKILSLIPDDWTMYFTEFKNKRSYLINDFKEESKDFSFASTFYESSSQALSYAQSLINKDDVILVFGSFFLLEEII
jgi:dihydrofolate synthase/folylpolyglutamate synthase